MNEKLLLSVGEAAEMLGVSRRLVYDLIHAEGFPAVKLGGRRFIHRELLAEWMKARAQKGVTV